MTMVWEKRKRTPPCRVGTLVQIAEKHLGHPTIIENGVLWIARMRMDKSPHTIWWLQSLATGKHITTKRSSFEVAREDD